MAAFLTKLHIMLGPLRGSQKDINCRHFLESFFCIAIIYNTANCQTDNNYQHLADMCFGFPYGWQARNEKRTTPDSVQVSLLECSTGQIVKALNIEMERPGARGDRCYLQNCCNYNKLRLCVGNDETQLEKVNQVCRNTEGVCTVTLDSVIMDNLCPNTTNCDTSPFSWTLYWCWARRVKVYYNCSDVITETTTQSLEYTRMYTDNNTSDEVDEDLVTIATVANESHKEDTTQSSEFTPMYTNSGTSDEKLVSGGKEHQTGGMVVGIIAVGVVILVAAVTIVVICIIIRKRKPPVKEERCSEQANRDSLETSYYNTVDDNYVCNRPSKQVTDHADFKNYQSDKDEGKKENNIHALEMLSTSTGKHKMRHKVKGHREINTNKKSDLIDGITHSSSISEDDGHNSGRPKRITTSKKKMVAQEDTEPMSNEILGMQDENAYYNVESLNTKDPLCIPVNKGCGVNNRRADNNHDNNNSFRANHYDQCHAVNEDEMSDSGPCKNVAEDGKYYTLNIPQNENCDPHHNAYTKLKYLSSDYMNVDSNKDISYKNSDVTGRDVETIYDDTVTLSYPTSGVDPEIYVGRSPDTHVATAGNM